MNYHTQMFIGRKRELAILNEVYSTNESAFIPIYGRRRVGKSELILHFLRNKRSIYFLGKKAEASLQRREFLDEAATVLNEPLLSDVDPTDWSKVIETVILRWSNDEKCVIVFDEFQWTVDASPELPSLIQGLWDRKWQASGQVLLILCGSYIGFMEKEVLGRQSPLFGRRTHQILLRPFDFREASGFHPNFSVVDHARTYFLCGGIPYYLRFFNDQSSVESNIIEQFLNVYRPLYHEADFLLREELREVEVYYAILVAISKGKATNKEIGLFINKDVRHLQYYLNQLLELGYIIKRYPLNDERRSSRNVRYDIADPVLRFSFRFILPNTSLIQHHGAGTMFRERIKPYMAAYFGYCFQRLCREALATIYLREGVSAAFQVGEFWSKTVQVDVVGFRDDGWTDLGECKWGTILSTGAAENELRQKILLYPNNRKATIGCCLFMRKKPNKTRPSNNFRWYDLEDMYAEDV